MSSCGVRDDSGETSPVIERILTGVTSVNQNQNPEPARTQETKRLTLLVVSRWFAAGLFLGILLFVQAGTVDYWQAWVFMGILLIPAFVVMLVGVRAAPDLIQRRMRLKERVPEQRGIVKYYVLLLALALVIPGLDRRLGWSSVPIAVVVAADIVVFLGYVLFVLVLKENRYASRVVEVEQGQPVIRSGPYAVVRHPMYVAILMIYVLCPLALASYWGLAISVWFVPVLVARIRSEESVLARDLPGYIEYTRSTPSRLVPGIW